MSALPLPFYDNPILFGRSGSRGLIAFESDESGASEIYVAPFGKTGRRRVSTGGGTQPRWKADGREVFFTTMTGEVMGAAVRGNEPIEIAPPVRLFHGCGGSPAAVPSSIGQSWFEVAADGTARAARESASTVANPKVPSKVSWDAVRVSPVREVSARLGVGQDAPE